ncbi:YqcI/YcgG family protein [Thalassobacillus pellis]|uniref:YqcI/YcgG family protein n=1 Tax=Thalassobacillus pellis TaxID=748008 RepID=UPI00195FA2D9|nr:YqcI/YcgG family protein [Thalassobacillus pellis]MBM7553891.1 FPC/CPF motif-containing protein YcgG [Thalassobacillus pellis]
MLIKDSPYLLTKEAMEKENSDYIPDWLAKEYETFQSIVTDPTFPCFFGRTGQRRGELRYSFIDHDKWDHLPDAVESFLHLFDKPDSKRHGLFIFVEPETEEQSIEYYRSYFWDILQYLHEKDRFPWPKDAPKDPEHYLWDFHFAGQPIFTFGNAPAYKQRKTRDLGNSLILGFQPRVIFQGLEGTEKGGIMSREKVRSRVEKWDGLPTHPDISHFGDPNHNEWKQSFIGDDIKPIEGKCPFHHKEL